MVELLPLLGGRDLAGADEGDEVRAEVALRGCAAAGRVRAARFIADLGVAERSDLSDASRLEPSFVRCASRMCRSRICCSMICLVTTGAVRTRRYLAFDVVFAARGSITSGIVVRSAAGDRVAYSSRGSS